MVFVVDGRHKEGIPGEGDGGKALEWFDAGTEFGFVLAVPEEEHGFGAQVDKFGREACISETDAFVFGGEGMSLGFTKDVLHRERVRLGSLLVHFFRIVAIIVVHVGGVDVGNGIDGDGAPMLVVDGGIDETLEVKVVRHVVVGLEAVVVIVVHDGVCDVVVVEDVGVLFGEIELEQLEVGIHTVCSIRIRGCFTGEGEGSLDPTRVRIRG